MEEEKKDNTVSKEEGNKIPEMVTKTDNEMVIRVSGDKERLYRFHIPFGAPLVEAYNAACNTASEVARLFKEDIERQKEAEEKKEEKE